MSFQMKIINTILKHIVKPVLTYTPFSQAILSPTKITVDLMTHAALRPLASYTTIMISDTLRCEWTDFHCLKSVDEEKVVLYLHGGGYIFGSPSTHRSITSSLSKYANCRVLAVDYRKAPKNKYPCALNDAIAAYIWLLMNGYKPEHISIAGDSAGGNLTLELTREIIDRDLPKPASICAISPWCALYSLKEYYTDNENDPMLPGARIREAGEMYAGSYDVKDARLSPLNMEFDEFPPTMMTVGTREVLNKSIKETFSHLLEDSEDNVKNLHTFLEYNNCPHVFQIFYGIAPEAKQSIKDISSFFKSNWN